MIRLYRSNKPEKLIEKEIELTNLYIQSKADVWNQSYIKKELLSMSKNKCCYCETKLQEESKYMTVDHFHPKCNNPNEVVEWTNLLPACSRCNSNKGNHDTYIYPIVNPTNDNPIDYFYISNYRFKSKKGSLDQKARLTIEVLGLNDSEKIVLPRFNVGEQICDKIDDLYQKAIEYKNKGIEDIGRKNQIIRGVKNVLKQGQPSSEYGGTIATIILNNDEYKYLKVILEELSIWDNELNKLHNEAVIIKYDIST